MSIPLCLVYIWYNGGMLPQEVPYRRLQSLQLIDSAFSDVGKLITWMGAVQAQDYTSSKWALGVRLPGFTDIDIEDAIAAKQIVRTWPMRGTLHFVPARDAKWMLQLMASKTVQSTKTRRANLNLTDEELQKARLIIQNALSGGRTMERTALLQAIEDGGVSVASQRGYHILAHHAWQGLICLGPMQGKKPTFVLLDEWIPNSVELSRDEALTEMAVRYAQSHGPITVHDLSRWIGLSMKDARFGLQNAGARLATTEIAGAAHWMQPHAPALPKTARDTLLLPAFDEFVIGYKDRTAVLHGDHENKVVPGGNGMFLPLVVADGQVIGVWKRTIAKTIAVQVMLFASPTATQKDAITVAAQQFAQFVNVPLGKLEWITLHY
jgi:hypothetical protein